MTWLLLCAVVAFFLGVVWLYQAPLHAPPGGIAPEGPHRVEAPHLEPEISNGIPAPGGILVRPHSASPVPSPEANNWPLVAIVAIVAVFLATLLALMMGRNITIVRKVTEQVSGRVEITKFRERASRKRAVA